MPDFVLLIEIDDTDISVFRCFSHIEFLCDFLEWNLLDEECARPDNFSTSDWKRLRTHAVALIGEVRKDFLLRDPPRKALNKIIRPTGFEIGWWGKFSYLVSGRSWPGTLARTIFLNYQDYWSDEHDYDNPGIDPVDAHKVVPRRKADHFAHVLNEYRRDELPF